jgi:hypothetical protein
MRHWLIDLSWRVLPSMVGGLLAYGVSFIDSPSITSWQALFMILGIVTVLWGAFIGWFLPDSPMRAKCWPEETRVRMVERVRDNQTGLQNKCVACPSHLLYFEG